MPIDPRMVKWDEESKPSIDTRMVKWDSEQVGPAEDIGNRIGNLVEGAGLAIKAPYVGVKDWFANDGGESVRQYKQAVEENSQKPGGFGGQVLGGGAIAAPLMMIPGMQGWGAQTAIGGAYGLTYPAESGQERAINTASGAVGSVLGYGAGKAINSASKGFVTAAERKAETEAAKNAMRDAAVKDAQQAGYTLPRSEYNPTFLSNRLESVGGKAAIKQEAISRNQDVTNKIAKESLGIPEDQPLSVSALNKVRDSAYEPYREISKLPKVADVPDRPANWTMMDPGAKGKKGFDPAKALEDLKQARHDAKAQYEFYNRSADPEVLAKAKKLDGQVDSLEKSIEDYAVSLGRDDLVPQLREARKTIAQTYTVERALNKTTGDVDARVFGRLHGKQKPLSDGLEKIGRFAEGFPKYAGYGPTNPTAGVSKSEALAGSILGAGTAAATGNPLGLMAAGIPLLSHPARSLALSNIMQSGRKYPVGLIPRLPGMAANGLPLAGAAGSMGLLDY